MGIVIVLGDELSALYSIWIFDLNVTQAFQENEEIREKRRGKGIIHCASEYFNQPNTISEIVTKRVSHTIFTMKYPRRLKTYFYTFIPTYLRWLKLQPLEEKSKQERKKRRKNRIIERRK